MAKDEKKNSKHGNNEKFELVILKLIVSYIIVGNTTNYYNRKPKHGS